MPVRVGSSLRSTQPTRSTPEHIAEIKAHVEKYPPRQVPKIERKMRLSGLEPFVHG